MLRYEKIFIIRHSPVIDVTVCCSVENETNNDID